MAIKETNTRVQLTITKSMLAKVDKAAQEDDIERRDYITQAIREKLMREGRWLIKEPSKPINTKAVHFTHCYQGEYTDSCKYGEEDCPAKPK